MPTNSLGHSVKLEECIFPLVSFLPNKQQFKCLGTAFFINPYGGFVTAKHVLFDKEDKNVPTLYAVQTLANGRRLVRSISHFVPHQSADIAIGMLGRIVNTGQNLHRLYPTPPINTSFALSLKKINNGDQIKTYAFPQTKSEDAKDGSQIFTFQGKWSEGEIVEFHPEGSPVVRNPCYQTSMDILDGASGGPVIRRNHIIGVNSSGMILLDGEIPISFITPISFLADLEVPQGSRDRRLISVDALIRDGSIASEK